MGCETGCHMDGCRLAEAEGVASSAELHVTVDVVQNSRGTAHTVAHICSCCAFCDRRRPGGSRPLRRVLEFSNTALRRRRCWWHDSSTVVVRIRSAAVVGPTAVVAATVATVWPSPSRTPTVPISRFLSPLCRSCRRFRINPHQSRHWRLDSSAGGDSREAARAAGACPRLGITERNAVVRARGYAEGVVGGLQDIEVSGPTEGANAKSNKRIMIPNTNENYFRCGDDRAFHRAPRLSGDVQ